MIKLISRPMRIFTHANPTWEVMYAQREAIVLNHIVKCYASSAPLEPYVLHHLECFPRICGSLRGGLEMRRDILEFIIARPLCLLYFLLRNYDQVAEKYEELLLGNDMGEYIFEILSWSKETGHALRKPLPYYLQFLTRDPYWGLRTAGLLGNTTFVHQIAARSYIEREQSAGAAFFYLTARPNEEISDALQTPFSDNPFYAVIGLHTLYPRYFTARGIDAKRLNPRWACHLLCFGERINDIECEKVVLQSPEWLVEYIMEKDIGKQNPERVADLYKRCVEASHPHPLIKELHAWFERYKAA